MDHRLMLQISNTHTPTLVISYLRTLDITYVRTVFEGVQYALACPGDLLLHMTTHSETFFFYYSSWGTIN